MEAKREEEKQQEQNQRDKHREGTLDHPEQYPTENESLFDLHEEEQNVDPIPMEDLNMEKQEEKDKDATKHRSSSEDKYKTGF